MPKRLAMDFDASSLPLSSEALLTAVATKGVQLESVTLRASLVLLTVRVLNLSFEKSVTVRVTTDGWASYDDVTASYLPGSSDPSSDRFYVSGRGAGVLQRCSAGPGLLSFSPAPFLLALTHAPTVPSQATLNSPAFRECEAIEFCICYKSPDREFWDNNGGKNYTVSLSRTTGSLRFGGGVYC